MDEKEKGKRKTRVFQHIMEDGSYQIVKDSLPPHWEFLFVQVKSVKRAELDQKKIFPVKNVSKSVWEEDKSEWIDLKVVKYDMETDLLYTVQMQGASVVVLLFLVELSTKACYFVCVNDYIDKYLYPSNPKFISQNDVRLYIPASNILSDIPLRDHALTLYGKRAKFLAAFSMFAYQKNEFQNFLGYKSWPVQTYRDEVNDKEPPFPDFALLAKYFLNQIDNLDIWQFSGWPILQITKSELNTAKIHFDQSLEEIQKDKDKSLHLVVLLWHHLTNLNNLYEEITREIYLPKFIGLLVGPNPPNVHEAEK